MAAVLVLVANVASQIFDSNYYFLNEATSLLAGDHPYRDFFELGAPLPAYLSAAAQRATGHRLIGEFATAWVFIVAGVVLAFDLALRISRSVVASLIAMAFALLVLATTATYHYTKLFVFPAALWLAWRFLDRPNERWAAALGVMTTVAFFFRHDYGLYVGFVSVAALAMAHLPAQRWTRHVARHGVAYAAAAAVVAMPWAAVVQANEGLIDYVRTRTTMYEQPASAFVYSMFLKINPLRELAPAPAPTPRSATVGFFWNDRADETQRAALIHECGLRSLGREDARGRSLYEAVNIYDPCLLRLDALIVDGIGFDWDRLRARNSYFPSRDNATLWLAQVMLLIPPAILIAAAVDVWSHRHRSLPVSADLRPMVVAAAFVVVVQSSLFREPAYMVTVAPLAAALSTRFLAARSVITRAGAVALLVPSVFAATTRAKDAPMMHPSQLPGSLSSAFHQLMATPPIHENPLFAYLRDCTAPGDHVLVTGSTPFHVSYVIGRPIAGGHTFWSYGWRSDPAHEQQSLALLQRQSVPFVVAEREPALADFERYPRIHEYLVQRYKLIHRTQPAILVDRERTPTGSWGEQSQHLPCFRAPGDPRHLQAIAAR